MAIQGANPEQRRITPHLIVRDAVQAIDFYRRALGAVELYRSPLPDGKHLHAHLKIADTIVMVTEEFLGPEAKRQAGPTGSPQSLNGTSVIMELYVDDVDAAYRRAVDAGGTPTLPLCDTFWGDRYGWVSDPFGHVWALSMVKEVLTPEQVQERMMEYFAQAR